MAGQLESRLQQVSADLEAARKNTGLKDSLKQLEAKLSLAEQQA